MKNNIKIKFVNKFKELNKRTLCVRILNTDKAQEDLSFFKTENSVFNIDEVISRVKENEQVLLTFFSKNTDVLLVPFKTKNFSTDTFRDKVSKVIGEIDLHYKRVVLNLKYENEYNTKFENSEHFYTSILEGILLGNYSFDKLKSDKKKIKNLDVEILTNEKMSTTIISKTEKLLSAVNFTRDLVNEPANILTPQEFVNRIKAHFINKNVKVEILDAKKMKKLNMNSLLSVGMGSKNESLMVKLHYKPKTKSKEKFALVGKGVTYDTGGYSLKPTPSMLDMKADMGGAAVVTGIISAAADLNLKIELIGFLPIVENMVSGSAYKPSDVIHTASGRTIEVGNTDAEGRLILADALEYAEKQKPNFIFDFATLTGACVVALGESYAGYFTNNENLSIEIVNASASTYERIWRLPLPEDYNEQLKSTIADTSNIGERWGGAITAALFLKGFLSEEMQENWVHFDIAGPTMKHKQSYYTNKFATGYGVRLITEFLKRRNG